MAMACSQWTCQCRYHHPPRCITINLLYRRYLWFMYHKCRPWYQYIRLHIIIVCIQTTMVCQIIININFPSCKEIKRPCRNQLVVHNNANNVGWFYIAYIACLVGICSYVWLCDMVWCGVVPFLFNLAISYLLWCCTRDISLCSAVGVCVFVVGYFFDLC